MQMEVGMTGIRGAVESASASLAAPPKSHGRCDVVCEIHHHRARLAVDAIGRPEPVNRVFSGSRLLRRDLRDNVRQRPLR